MSVLESHQRFSLRRLKALVVKEALQVLRDPSSLLIAFVLPPILLWLFANAMSLDVDDVPFGVVLEGVGDASFQLAAAFEATPYFDAHMVRDRREVEDLITRGSLRGYVVIPQNFDEVLAAGGAPQLQVITDASQPNTANFVYGYAEGVLSAWMTGRPGASVAPVISLEPRFWFNPELDSRRVLTVGGFAIVMTIIGTLLTALVMAREDERGTMEAMMSTPASMLELLIAKLAPYFLLGMGGALGCAWMLVNLYGVPFRGSLGALLAVSACFMVPALGQGLLISTLARTQFIAAQLAVFSAFMPATLLSGALFEIDSMPVWLQPVTLFVSARPYVGSLQTVFLAGDVWPQFLRDMAELLLLGMFFFALTLRRARKSLD